MLILEDSKSDILLMAMLVYSILGNGIKARALTR